MEYGGVALVAAVAVIATLIPYLAARRTAILESREGDRFSPGLRILPAVDPRRIPGGSGGDRPRLLPATTRITHVRGEIMTQTEPSRRPVTRAARMDGERVRELARLRARRAARLSAQAAAGRRRFVISATLAVLLLAVVAVCALTSLPWGWALIPALLLAASLITSRMAAVRFEEAGAAEEARYRELLAAAHGSRAEAAPATGAEDAAEAIVADEGAEGAVEDVAGVDADTTDAEAAVEATDVVDEGRGVETVLEADVVVAEGEATDASPVENLTAPAPVSAVESADSGAIEAVATVERSTWTPTPVPAPLYATRGRVARREVHADTDLRGIPRVPAAVPARPIAASATPADARSTEEVVASQAVAFDLDSVLASRRAQ